MKLLLGLIGLVFAASALPYDLNGGYKQNAKYIYHYEGRIRPSQVPLLQPQFVELFISCTVELHPLSIGKFILQISKYDLTARVSDPKYTDGPVDYRNYGEFESLAKHIKKPIKFTYHKGLVQKVFPMPGDAVFSINLKRGIINLFHVDIQGKNLQTKDEELFDKTEESIIGVCPTSYSVNEYKVISAKRAWTRIGYNVTKVIHVDNCTESDVEVFNKVVPGPNEQPSTNPLKSTATIKYNILGSKLNFKIEEVHAVGTHVLYLTSKDGGSIDSVTDQGLKLVRREVETMTKSQISDIEHRCNLPFMMMMRVGSFGHMEQVPAQTETDKYNLVEFVFSKLIKFVAVLPALEKPWTVEISEVSQDLLEIVNVIRTADLIVHEKIWERCIANPVHMKWMVYMFSLCNTENCMSFMKEKINTLPEELIAHYLFVVGYNGNPTMKMVEWMKDVVMLTKITKSAYLTKTAYLSATSMIKTWCKQNVCQKLWIDQILETALQHILKSCTWEMDTCRPISNLTATVVLALAENVERPTLLPFLEQIVAKDSIPVEVRVKAVLAIRPLVKIAPTRVHIAMLRIFSNVTCDTELRILCFAVIMDNPTSHMIWHIAQEMKREPSAFLRRFIYDKWIAMRYTKLSAPKIDTAIRLALKMFPKNKIPSRWTMSNCYHLYHHCKNWSAASLWRHEEIYKKNFMPTFINSRLHIEVLGRRFSLFEAQLRVQGLQEYLSNMMGPNGLLNEGEPLLRLLRGQSELKPISEKLEQLRQKIPTYSVPDEKFKIFSQFKIFDKISHIGEKTMHSKFDLQKMLYSESLPRMLGMAHELQKGVEYKFSKPCIPFEAIYRMPTLIGVPMTCNLTSMLIPVSVSKLTINTTPNLFSWKTLLSQKIDSVHVDAQQRLWAILDVRGQINFRIPNLEVGGYMKTKTNISTNLKATVNYDVKMRTFKTEVDTPEDIREVWTMTRNTYHYFKSENWHHKTNSGNQKLDVSEFHLTKSNKKPSLEERFKRSEDDSDWYEPTSDVKDERFRNTRIRIVKKKEGTPGSDAKVPQTSTVRTDVPSTTVSNSVTPVMPVPASEVLEIPIELDQMKNIQVFGIKKGINKFSEQWTLKVNGQFIAVVGNKLILSNRPTVFDVKFVGFNRRIVRLSFDDQGFVTIPRNNPCLTMTKTKSDIGQLFVVTMVRPNIFKICAVTHLVPSSVPKEWGMASQSELNKIEEIERLFQKEMVPLEREDLDETEKIETGKQTARLTYWTIKNNCVWLTPFENKAVMPKILPKTPLNQVLQKLAYTKGFCYGTTIGVKTCLYGYRLFPSQQFLSMLFAPMEYRWIMSPTTKGQKNKMQVKISIPNPSTDPIVQLATISWKTMNPEKKIKIKSTISKAKREWSVELTPSDAKMTDFSKMCLHAALKPDNMIFSISFDPQCTHKNLDVDIITAKTFPRFWMAFRMKYSTRFMPNYILDALKTISVNVIEPFLQSTFYVHPALHPWDAYMSMTTLKFHLTKNDTMSLHLKTANNFYYMDDVKLPKIIESLPFGSSDIPLMTKWPNTLMTPHCMHKDRSFVTFDKKPFNFTLRGQCEHELLRMCDKRKTDIAVTTRKVGETKKRAVTIVVESKTFEFIPEGEMHERPTIMMNGIKREFSGTRHDINDPKTKKPWVSFIWEPTTKCITLIYYKYTLVVKLREAYVVTLTISPMFANKTCGLCGNFDGEKWNDFTIPEGQVVNDVTRPTAFYSQVKTSEETIFASNWITPGKKCNKGCPFARRFVKAYMPGKLCLTNYRVGQCAIPCRATSDKDMVKIPVTCVPPLRFKELEKYMLYGTPMKWDHVTEMLMDLPIPKKCHCKC